MTAIEQSLALWIPQVQGRYINEDWNPANQGFGAQCWDIPASWSKYLGLPVISTGNTAAKRGRWPGWAGNMIDAFPQSPAIAAAYELLGPANTVQPGDILVWDDSHPVWFPKTHTAVGIRDLGAQILCVSQNSTAAQPGNPYPQWTTGPTTVQHLPRRGLLGIIRPRAGGTITTQGTAQTTEEDDPLAGHSREELIQIVAEGVESWAVNNKVFPGATPDTKRNFRDHLIQTRTEVGAVKNAVDGLPKAILEDYRVEGRNVIDNFKQVRTDLFGTRGNVDVQALAKSIAEQLPKADAEALVDALAARLAGGQ